LKNKQRNRQTVTNKGTNRQTVNSEVFFLQLLLTQPSHSSIMADVFTIGQSRAERNVR